MTATWFDTIFFFFLYVIWTQAKQSGRFILDKIWANSYLRPTEVTQLVKELDRANLGWNLSVDIYENIFPIMLCCFHLDRIQKTKFTTKSCVTIYWKILPRVKSCKIFYDDPVTWQCSSKTNYNKKHSL